MTTSGKKKTWPLVLGTNAVSSLRPFREEVVEHFFVNGRREEASQETSGVTRKLRVGGQTSPVGGRRPPMDI